MSDHPEVKELFLSTAQVVVAAIADDLVAARWDDPSVLEDQKVSGLVGHLARGGVWVVDDYLNGPRPAEHPSVDSAAAYFATWAGSATASDHSSIRDRRRQVASVGRVELIEELDRRLAELGHRLRTVEPDMLVGVAGGTIVMRIADYLVTRIIEQVVHLDDLARSVDRESWDVPDGAMSLVLDVGLEIARRRSSDQSVLRGLYRAGHADVAFPVLR